MVRSLSFGAQTLDTADGYTDGLARSSARIKKIYYANASATASKMAGVCGTAFTNSARPLVFEGPREPSDLKMKRPDFFDFFAVPGLRFGAAALRHGRQVHKRSSYELGRAQTKIDAMQLPKNLPSRSQN